MHMLSWVHLVHRCLLHMPHRVLLPRWINLWYSVPTTINNTGTGGLQLGTVCMPNRDTGHLPLVLTLPAWLLLPRQQHTDHMPGRPLLSRGGLLSYPMRWWEAHGALLHGGLVANHRSILPTGVQMRLRVGAHRALEW